ncbi:MAG: protein-methionine-sulfoxide reductase catalytic subunit MsrP [Candidatus Puniceispirillaceae bacterium]
MLIRKRPSWHIPESQATDESAYLNRRHFLKNAGLTGLGLSGALTSLGNLAHAAPITGFPAARNDSYQLDRAITPEEDATTYTNFYEFGSSKNIWRKAAKLQTDPWMVTIDGLCDNPMEIDASDLIKKMGPMEERLYRHRCVEAWAMAVPWTGVPLANLLKLASPKSDAKYLIMETFLDPKTAPGQKQVWFPWPYIEGLRLDEAMNEMSFLATGLYGREMPKQNGAPIRLVVPWKYGFKSIKSITRFTFSDTMPVSFWMESNGEEYGFWANVNPEVRHKRWSQETERLLGSNEQVPTQLYNGYEEQVSYLYKDMKNTPIFF